MFFLPGPKGGNSSFYGLIPHHLKLSLLMWRYLWIRYVRKYLLLDRPGSPHALELSLLRLPLTSCGLVSSLGTSLLERPK